MTCEHPDDPVELWPIILAGHLDHRAPQPWRQLREMAALFWGALVAICQQERVICG